MPLELANAWYRYGRAWVVRGASLRLGGSEVVALVGPNGAGKTTILKLMAGLLKPCRGDLLVDGASLWGMSERERLAVRRGIVYVHEKPVMVRGSVWDNIALGLRLRGAGEDLIASRVEWAARLMGLEDLLEERASTLSAGQAQAVSIARALALKPRYLLLDEPHSSLDRARRGMLVDVLRMHASRGVGIAVATHDLGLVDALWARLVEVEGGVIVRTGGG
ncbi:MAG: ATP-binding cassette domain-containing protein [Desulfurococcales archaeon]|nr:ATP-binding cassette domain-containing protein [Desulfurococcales archaeon]